MVTVSVPATAVPAVDVAGTVAATVSEAVAPGATVPELAPWTAKTASADADQVIAAGPVFLTEYDFVTGCPPQSTRPKSTGSVLSETEPPSGPPSAPPSANAPSNPPPPSACESELVPPKQPPTSTPVASIHPARAAMRIDSRYHADEAAPFSRTGDVDRGFGRFSCASAPPRPPDWGP